MNHDDSAVSKVHREGPDWPMYFEYIGDTLLPSERIDDEPNIYLTRLDGQVYGIQVSWQSWATDKRTVQILYYYAPGELHVPKVMAQCAFSDRHKVARELPSYLVRAALQ